MSFVKIEAHIIKKNIKKNLGGIFAPPQLGGSTVTEEAPMSWGSMKALYTMYLLYLRIATLMFSLLYCQGNINTCINN